MNVHTMQNLRTELVWHLKYLTKIEEKLVIEDNTDKLSKNSSLKNQPTKKYQKPKPQHLHQKNKGSFVLGDQI